jgi:hypothetical protein
VGYIPGGDIKFFEKLKIGRSIKLEKVQSAINEEDYL